MRFEQRWVDEVREGYRVHLARRAELPRDWLDKAVNRYQHHKALGTLSRFILFGPDPFPFDLSEMQPGRLWEACKVCQ